MSDTILKRPAEFAPGDLVDLEDRDQTPENAQIWPYEYAEVEAVSTAAHRAGGWADALLDASPDLAVVYTTNGASPAVILAARHYALAALATLPEATD